MATHSTAMSIYFVRNTLWKDTLLFIFNMLSGKKTFLSTSLTKEKLTEVRLVS